MGRGTHFTRQLAAFLFLVSWCLPAHGAVLPLERELNDVRTSKIFKPLLYRKKLSCNEIDSVYSHALMAYPNPFFLKRLRGLQTLHRCGRDPAGVSEVKRALKKSPRHLSLVGRGTWVCPFFNEDDVAIDEAWAWIDVSAEFHPNKRYPKCLPKEWQWLWSALRHYHQRRYRRFEKKMMAQRSKWDQALDETGLRAWAWDRVILSGKRRGDRIQVLKYYRKWYRTLRAGLPKRYRGHRDREHRNVEMWLLRWEGLLGNPARGKRILSWWKKHCGKQVEYFDYQCKEFLTVWLSRYWFENHDSGLGWIPRFRENENVMWWRSMRHIARKEWKYARNMLRKLRRKTRRALLRKRSNFWLAYVNSMRYPAKRVDYWQRFIEIYGGEDFYSIVAHFFAEKDWEKEPKENAKGKLVTKVSLSTDTPVTSASCQPSLHQQWPDLEKGRGGFIVEDDVKWFSDRLTREEASNCKHNKRTFKTHLLKYCSPTPLWHEGKVPFEQDFAKASVQSRLPKHLLIGLSRQESAFCPNAVSWADAIGLMQLQWSPRIRALKFLQKPEHLFDPLLNLRAGSWELKRLSKNFKANWFKVLAAYNAGEDVVKLWQKRRPHSSTLQFIELIPFQETRQYVKKVFRNWYRYEKEDQKKKKSRAQDSLRILARR